MRVLIDMVGCRLNQAEIDGMARELNRRGHKIITEPEQADAVIVNTCCVTAKAAADSRKMIRRYQNLTNAKIIPTGCWATAFADEAVQLVGPEAVVSNFEKDRLVEAFFPTENTECELPAPRLGKRQRTRAFVKVQDGCDNRCAYCLTQIARGPSRSRGSSVIADEVNLLSQMGYREIILTGVQLGSWGKELGNLRLSNLVSELLVKTEIPRIRLSSLEPWDFSDELIEVLKDDRICNHFHIPMQTGSPTVLKRMNRPSSPEFYRVLAAKLLEAKGSVGITTDIIVGFPGETEYEFEETMQLIKDLPLTGGHVFQFSPMKGTVAAGMSSQIKSGILKGRSRELICLFQQKTNMYLQTKLGTAASVLWEGSRKIAGENWLSGLSTDNLRVAVPFRPGLKNSISNVMLQSFLTDNVLLGTL